MHQSTSFEKCNNTMGRSHPLHYFRVTFDLYLALELSFNNILYQWVWHYHWLAYLILLCYTIRLSIMKYLYMALYGGVSRRNKHVEKPCEMNTPPHLVFRVHTFSPRYFPIQTPFPNTEHMVHVYIFTACTVLGKGGLEWEGDTST